MIAGMQMVTEAELSRRWRMWRTSGVVAITMLASAPATMAQEEDPGFDARLEGFDGAAVAKESSGAIGYIVMLLLIAVGMGVLFKNSRRTHLD